VEWWIFVATQFRFVLVISGTQIGQRNHPVIFLFHLIFVCLFLAEVENGRPGEFVFLSVCRTYFFFTFFFRLGIPRARISIVGRTRTGTESGGESERRRANERSSEREREEKKNHADEKQQILTRHHSPLNSSSSSRIIIMKKNKKIQKKRKK
jgi:hypothetical protein